MQNSYEDENTTYISDETPLLSNLSLLENITVMPQVRENKNLKESEEVALKATSTLGIEDIIHLRYTECSHLEIFYIQLIRANILKDVRIIIDRPFNLVSEEDNTNFIYKALSLLNINLNKVSIIDLNSQESYYKEEKCLIRN